MCALRPFVVKGPTGGANITRAFAQFAQLAGELELDSLDRLQQTVEQENQRVHDWHHFGSSPHKSVALAHALARLRNVVVCYMSTVYTNKFGREQAAQTNSPPLRRLSAVSRLC